MGESPVDESRNPFATANGTDDGALTPASVPAQQSQAPTQSAKPAPAGFVLEDGTPVKLRLSRNLSSATDKKGDQVDFEVLEDVSVDNVLVIPRGAVALATITEAEHKKSMGRGGKLDVNIDSVRLKDGERATLRAVKEGKGGGHVGAMTGAMVGTAIVFFPAAPLFLFIHGKDMNIPFIEPGSNYIERIGSSSHESRLRTLKQ